MSSNNIKTSTRDDVRIAIETLFGANEFLWATLGKSTTIITSQNLRELAANKPWLSAASSNSLINSSENQAYYSALSNELGKIVAKQQSAEGWLDNLEGLINNGKVKADEVEWTGVADWLKLQGGKVTKEALMQYLDGNGVQVDEVIGSPTKYAVYQLDGGTNYREVLLTLPGKQKLLDKTTVEYDNTDFQSPRFAELQAQRQKLNAKSDYKSSHWDAPNVLAHIRLNDRTDADGKRVLFVEEVQSDFGQDKKAGKNVPNAPFIGSTDKWLTLALKRIATMAVQEGYDKVAFVNGEQSADRYGLSLSVDSVTWNEDNSQFLAIKNEEKVINKINVDARSLDAYLGKDVAKKLLNEPKNQRGNRTLTGLDRKVGGEGMKTFYDKIVPGATNALLKKIGGGKVERINFGGVTKEALDEYAQLDYNANYEELSDRAQAIVLFAVKAEGSNTTLENQLGFTITDKMRESVTSGLPLFSKNSAKVQAFFDSKEQHIYMVADRIKRGAETAVWLHEIFHKRGMELLGKENLDKLYFSVLSWRNHQEGSVERAIYEGAHSRAKKSNQYNAEFLAYAIEEACALGVTPDSLQGVNTAGGWLAKVRDLFSDALNKLVGKPSNLEARDLVSIAYGAAKIDYVASFKNRTADDRVYWHGSYSGNLRGGTSGLHLGTKLAAAIALESRIGVPATGEWDGARVYAETMLAGRKTLERLSKERGYSLITGHNCSPPEEDYYPTARISSQGYYHPLDLKPSVKPYKLVAEMMNRPWHNLMDDTRGNATMRAQLTKINAKKGLYYTNDFEDPGSMSVVVPDGAFLKAVNPDGSDIKNEPLLDEMCEMPATPLGPLRTIVFNHNEYSVYNAAGEPLSETIEGVRNFIRWFGHSVCTHNGLTMLEGGLPRPMYHGSPSKGFSEFSRDKRRSNTDAGWLGRGFYFFPCERDAEAYGFTEKVYLKMENPYFQTQNEHHITAEGGATESDLFTQRVLSDGCDGVYYNADCDGETMVFNPNQIKSCNENYGTFSPSVDNVFYSHAEADFLPNEEALPLSPKS